MRPPGPAGFALPSRLRPTCVRLPRFDQVASCPIPIAVPHVEAALPIRRPPIHVSRASFPLCVPVIYTRYPHVPLWPSRYVTAAPQPTKKGIVFRTQSVMLEGRLRKVSGHLSINPVRLENEGRHIPLAWPPSPTGTCFYPKEPLTKPEAASFSLEWRHLLSCGAT